MLLKFYGPGMCRNCPDVGNISMQCLHLLRRYFVPLPWRFLTQPELQQRSDQLNCNQKHFLMLYAIKNNCISSMNKLRAYFRVICAPIRSWSDISAQHFPSLPPGELCFWRREISSRRPEILYRLINVPAQNFVSSSHLVTMSAMPPVDNYINIYFYWKTVTGPRYYNGIWSTWNAKVIAQSPAITAPQRERTGGLLVVDAEKKIVFHGH